MLLAPACDWICSHAKVTKAAIWAKPFKKDVEDISFFFYMYNLSNLLNSLFEDACLDRNISLKRSSQRTSWQTKLPKHSPILRFFSRLGKEKSLGKNHHQSLGPQLRSLEMTWGEKSSYIACDGIHRSVPFVAAMDPSSTRRLMIQFG